MKSLKNQKGFTLIELMIVVAIIGILAAIALPKFAQMLEKARAGQTKGNVGALRSAASIYYGDNGGSWPYTLSTTTAYFFSAYLDEIKPVANRQSIGAPASGPGVTGGSSVTYGAAASLVPAAVGGGWWYNSVLGGLYVNSCDSDVSKFPFTCY